MHHKLITTPTEMFDHCTDKLTTDKLSFIFVKKEDVQEVKDRHQARYKDFVQIPSTRKQHAFKPQADGVLLMGRTSDSDAFHPVHFRLPQPGEFNRGNLEPGVFYAFFEANSYQIGMLVEANDDEDDVKMQILKVNKRTPASYWPEEVLFTDIPYTNILMPLHDPAPYEQGSLMIRSEDMVNIRRAFTNYRRTLIPRE